MIRSDITRWPPRKIIRQLHRRMLRVRDLLLQRVEILNGPVRYRFDCGSVREFNRCLKMLTKEPGTVEWIETECAPGDVFYDIGANIGVFSIFAARRIEPGGKLYAFEPHAANFERLLANIECNNLQAVITPCSLPLHRHEEFGIFRYESLMAGSSSSQFGDSRAERPALEELKFAVSIDHLIETGRITAPHHIKIDVDGKELDILHGMSRLLMSTRRPRSLQVELNAGSDDQVVAFLGRCGYELTRKHYTRSGLRHLTQASSGSDSGCNGVFHPVSAGP